MSLAAKEQSKEGGLSVWEAEHHLDAELLLDEYPRWDVGGPHHPFILQQISDMQLNLGRKKQRG